MSGLLRPRRGAFLTSTVVAVIAWFQADVTGLDRVFTLAVTFVLAYLAFNAAAAVVERVGSQQ